MDLARLFDALDDVGQRARLCAMCFAPDDDTPPRAPWLTLDVALQFVQIALLGALLARR